MMKKKKLDGNEAENQAALDDEKNVGTDTADDAASEESNARKQGKEASGDGKNTRCGDGTGEESNAGKQGTEASSDGKNTRCGDGTGEEANDGKQGTEASGNGEANADKQGTEASSDGKNTRCGDGTDEETEGKPSFDELVRDGGFEDELERRIGEAVMHARAEWEESALSDLTQRAEKAENELTALRQENALRDSNVLKQFRGYVLFEIAKLEGVPFEEALARVIALNRWVASPVNPGMTTGMAQGTPMREKNGVERAFAEKNPSLRF